MIKTIHYECGCILSFKGDDKVIGCEWIDGYNTLCNKHDLTVGYDKK